MKCPNDTGGLVPPSGAGALLRAAAGSLGATLLVLFLLLLLVPPGLRAEEAAGTPAPKPAQGVEVIDVSFPEATGRSLPQAGGWLPVYVELRAASARPESVVIEGTVSVNGKRRFTERQTVEVSPGAPRRSWLYLRAAPDENLVQQVAALEVKTQGGNIIRKDGPWHLTAYAQTLISLLVVGEKLGDVKPWPGDLEVKQPRGMDSLDETAEGCPAKELPDSILGYGAVDVVVIRDTAEAPLEKAQIEALRSWVHMGGCVILVPSDRSGELFRSELARVLLGADLKEPRPVDGYVPGALFSWEKGTPPSVAQIELEPMPAGASYTLLDPLEGSGFREILSKESASSPGPEVRIYAEVSRGQGQVGVFTLDDQLHREESGFLQAVWGRIVTWRLGSRENPVRSAARFHRPELEGLLRDSSRDVGLPFITGLVVAYLLLVGPGLYFFLKRMERLPAVIWVEPLLVVGYLGVIFATAYITKGVLTKTRLWTFISQAQGDALARRQSYLTIYSGADSDYGIECPRGALLHPVFMNAGEERPVEIIRSPRGGLAIDGYRLAHWEQGHMTNEEVLDLGGTGLTVEYAASAGEDPGETRMAVIRSSLPYPVLEGVLFGPRGARSLPRIEPGGSIEVSIDADPVPVPSREKGDGGEASWRKVLATLASGRRTAHAGMSRLLAAALVDRRDEDFKVNRRSTLKERLDLYLLYE